MVPLFQKKIRLFALVSLLFMTQCCCCIIPVRWQVSQPPPAVLRVVERVEQVVQSQFMRFGPRSSLVLP